MNPGVNSKLEALRAALESRGVECLNSLGAETLSGVEADRGWIRCSRCGKELKIRPKKGEGGWYSCIIPRHNDSSVRRP